MKFFILFVMLISFALARPHYKDSIYRDYDYRLYEDDSSGVVVDRALPKHHHHHHHRQHHHKNYLKTNRMERGVRKFFDNFHL